MDPEIRVQVKVIEQGWAVVHFEGPKPFKYEQYHCLDVSLHSWLKQWPQHILQRVTPIEHEGEVAGLNAGYSAASPPQEQFSFDVAPEVRAEIVRSTWKR